VSTEIATTVARICEASHDDGYNSYHAPRYTALLTLLSEHLPGPDGRILDIGRSALTDLIRQTCGVRVDTLGFEPDERAEAGDHYHFNLNDAQQEALWRRDLPAYDVIVMAEVIEHLHTAPRLVLSFLSQLMAAGGVLIVQTPNAAALHKRLELLFGRNPYHLIREDVTNPGHFREYTMTELTDYARMVGLEVEAQFYGNYFDYRYRGHGTPGVRSPRPNLQLINIAFSLLPGSLKPGITLVLRKPS
jgi:SAM-dependent methyltransferase